MAKPVIRETKVDDELLARAEEIVDNFPSVTGNFDYDIEKYRENNKVLNDLLYRRNLPNDSEGIDKSKYFSGEPFLIVRLNRRVEIVLDKLIKLQSDHLDQILGK